MEKFCESQGSEFKLYLVFGCPAGMMDSVNKLKLEL